MLMEDMACLSAVKHLTQINSDTIHIVVHQKKSLLTLKGACFLTISKAIYLVRLEKPKCK